jgi:hypothetical protein
MSDGNFLGKTVVQDGNTTTITEYKNLPLKYESFEKYFKVIVPHLWSVKVWDNDTIKIWLEEAFESSREIK